MEEKTLYLPTEHNDRIVAFIGSPLGLLAAGLGRALAAQLARMKKGWTPEEGKLIVVGHGDCIDRAQELAEQVKTLYPDTEIYIAPIGPIIGSHTGPGMLALIFWGTER